jgi:hypothetical protein
MAGTFPPDYFDPGYFAPDYFGGEANANAMQASLAGTSTLTAHLTAAVVEEIEPQAGGGARRKREPEEPVYRPPLPLIKRPGLPSVYYRDFRPPAVTVAIKELIARKPQLPAHVTAALAASRVQADAVAAAAALQARNEQAIQALLAIIPLLELEAGPDPNEQAVQVLSILPMILEDA